MLLACKYEEVSVPVVEDLILLSDRAYTRAEVLEMVCILTINPSHFISQLPIIYNVDIGGTADMQEKLIVNTLHFNLSVPTPYVFMRRYLKAAESDKKVNFTSLFFCLIVDHRYCFVLLKHVFSCIELNQLELLSFFIIELCLIEYEMLRFRPSLLAAAAVYTAQCTLRGFQHWTKTSELHTCYSEEQLTLVTYFHSFNLKSLQKLFLFLRIA